MIQASAAGPFLGFEDAISMLLAGEPQASCGYHADVVEEDE